MSIGTVDRNATTTWRSAQKGRTSPDGNAGDLDRHDHFDQWLSYTKELPAERDLFDQTL